MMYGLRGYGFPFMGFGMFIGMIFCILFIGAIVYLIFRAFTRAGGNNRAIDILDEKYASGEISEEEYIKRKKLLKQR